MAKYCAFCDPEEIISRAIIESDNFVAIPTIGQISDGGHTLLFPKNHDMACLGMMSEELFDEFSSLKKRLERAIVEEYGPVLNFEHGIIGQTVSHAHLQMLPCKGYDLLFKLQQDYRFNKEISGPEELREVYDSRRVYLYYQQPSTLETEGRHFVFYMDAIPQYLRLVAAEVMGCTPRGDWKAWRADPDCAGVDDLLMNETVEKLKRRLE